MNQPDPMKTNSIVQLAAALLLSAFSLQPLALLAQGSLTPPGQPAPMMKTLDQIEPRTPIASVPFVITNPGSYYLVSNLDLAQNTDAITIATNGVTFDLKGFTIGTSFSSGIANGILLNGGNSVITILNGHILGSNTAGPTGGSSPSFGSGIAYAGPPPVDVRVVNVSIVECASYGINLGTNTSTVVEDCLVQSIGGYGIEAGAVFHSAAYGCGLAAVVANYAVDSIGVSRGGDGVDANFADGCYGSAGASGWGVYASSIANNCYGYVADGSGVPFSAGLFANQANNCYGRSDGVALGMFALSASHCYCTSSASNGLDAILATGCYCTGGGSGVGLFTTIANGCYANSGNITFKYNMP
jgi:hypothetical protein